MPGVELRPAENGAVAIWRDGQMLGMIVPTDEGLRLILGDADPGGGATLLWSGEPFSMRFDLTGGL